MEAAISSLMEQKRKRANMSSSSSGGGADALNEKTTMIIHSRKMVREEITCKGVCVCVYSGGHNDSGSLPHKSRRQANLCSEKRRPTEIFLCQTLQFLRGCLLEGIFFRHLQVKYFRVVVFFQKADAIDIPRPQTTDSPLHSPKLMTVESGKSSYVAAVQCFE